MSKDQKQTPELNKVQLEIREILVTHAVENLAKDYGLSNQDIADIFNITRQAVYQMSLRQRAKRIPK